MLASQHSKDWQEQSEYISYLQADVLQSIRCCDRLCCGAIQDLNANRCPTLGLENIAGQILARKVAFTTTVWVLHAQGALLVQAPEAPE